MRYPIIAIFGSYGSGRTTSARLLQHHLQTPSVVVSSENFRYNSSKVLIVRVVSARDLEFLEDLGSKFVFVDNLRAQKVHEFPPVYWTIRNYGTIGDLNQSMKAFARLVDM